MGQKVTTNEKMDRLYQVIVALSCIIFMLIAIILNWPSIVLMFPAVFIFTNMPLFFRRKKQFKRIGELQVILNISIEEMREIIHVNRFDLMAWEKGKMAISQKQLYELEAYLENQYLVKSNEKQEDRKLWEVL